MGDEMRQFVLAALFQGVAVAAGAQSGAIERVDRFVRAEMERSNTPGVAVAVIDKGQIVVAKGYGYANLEHGVAVGTNTVFQSGSVGKQFTATAVMALVDEGKIGLDDPLTQYFPTAPLAWRSVTVRHLLTHTSGMSDYEEPEESPAVFDYRRDYTEEELAELAFASKLEFPSGSRWSYCNMGYILLGIIIRKASGQFYGDVLRDKVFVPLGMKSARVISEEDIVLHRAAGYRLSNGTLKNQEWVSPSLNTTADGTLYLSIQDLIAWSKGLREGRILTAASWEQTYSPVVLKSGSRYPYGFGWFVDSFNGQPRLHHDGGWQGFASYISRDLGPDLTVIVLANAAHADPERLGIGIAGAYLPALAPSPAAPVAEVPEARQRLESLLKQTSEGQLSPIELAYVKNGFFPSVAARYRSRLASLGNPLQVSLMEHSVKGDDRIFVYELRYASLTLTATLGLAPDGKVSVFALRPKQAPFGI